MEESKLYFDGSINLKHQRVSYGFILLHDGQRYEVGPVPLVWGTDTVNTAEYQGLIEGMNFALQKGVTSLRVIGDSQLVLSQVQGLFRCRKDHLKPFLERTHQLALKFDRILFEWVGRKDNEADTVSRL